MTQVLNVRVQIRVLIMQAGSLLNNGQDLNEDHC